jgi:hypothetical protein
MAEWIFLISLFLPPIVVVSAAAVAVASFPNREHTEARLRARHA